MIVKFGFFGQHSGGSQSVEEEGVNFNSCHQEYFLLIFFLWHHLIVSYGSYLNVYQPELKVISLWLQQIVCTYFKSDLADLSNYVNFYDPQTESI
jgi:hypothetical protein